MDIEKTEYNEINFYSAQRLYILFDSSRRSDYLASILSGEEENVRGTSVTDFISHAPRLYTPRGY